MTVPVVADIGFDLWHLPIHLSMMVALIVDCIEAERSPHERDVMAERATNSMNSVLAIEMVPAVCYQRRHHQWTQLYSLVALRFVAPVSSYISENENDSYRKSGMYMCVSDINGHFSEINWLTNRFIIISTLHSHCLSSVLPTIINTQQLCFELYSSDVS